MDLSKYIGKEYIHTQADLHIRVLGIEIRPESDVNKDFNLKVCGYYKRIPLTNNPTGSVRSTDVETFYVEKTKTANILYGR